MICCVKRPSEHYLDYCACACCAGFGCRSDWLQL